MTASVDARPDPVVLRAASLYRFFRAGDEETLALQGVSLAVAPGEILAVAGPSGSGKSTLLACLAGIDEPDGGTVTVAGRRLSHRLEAERARLRASLVGLLFQSANLLAHLTVARNIQLVRRLVRGPVATPVDDLLDQLGIGRRGGAYPAELSGGELARAGLAVALANDPVVLLADEPTGELDLATERAVLELLRARARAGLAVVIASHSPAVAAAADRTVSLTDGRLDP
ncbi:ATP-binding cassette domain-containing protein [Pseudofrankia sp. BMG5.36]|uniref:ABC transporter ATP-binding protein n=1 Tax=Pseudofrankia sp. BMG5.36 TaxID=1834512 RepID=UPI000A75333D|nr:ATP-binding cassette domain-containing protein [Pseudofrankia sp. BMG5.36]